MHLPGEQLMFPSLKKLRTFLAERESLPSHFLKLSG
jgi:hypothetical protein